MASQKQSYKKFIKYIVGLIVAAGCSHVIQGDIRIIDADTVKIGQEKIRLLGVDAPETSQTCSCGGEKVECGKQATSALKDFVGTDKLYCKGDKRDRYGRIIGECFIRRNGAEISLNQWLVFNGYAVAYTQYSKKFADDEAVAKAEKRGFWACEYFQNPAEYRHGKKNRPHTKAKKAKKSKKAKRTAR